jgi:hypothetical protein
MGLTQINNGDTGLVARTKINDSFTTVDDLRLSASVQTTNGATTSVATLSMGTYSVYTIEARIAAWDDTNNLAYGSQLFAVFSNNGGSAQVSTTDTYEKSNFATASSHIILDTNPKIVVIGEASKTINWVVDYIVTKI